MEMIITLTRAEGDTPMIGNDNIVSTEICVERNCTNDVDVSINQFDGNEYVDGVRLSLGLNHLKELIDALNYAKKQMED